ncbi:hypothetical protein ACFOZ1_07970 [Gracilibacillus marinus]|uniref:Uncharacterized protein n=1 Tax=Gracilibacillus marinus TaxID=630535 RepID=A0ABV8VUS2_9BACI
MEKFNRETMLKVRLHQAEQKRKEATRELLRTLCEIDDLQSQMDDAKLYDTSREQVNRLLTDEQGNVQ